jgi:hypothetical protein
MHLPFHQVIVLNEDSTIYIAEDLVNVAKRGDYRLCIDIIEHTYYPVSPNAMDTNRQSAT